MKYLIKTSKDFQNLLNNYRNKKILIITGKNSFNKSGAEEIFKKIQTKNLSFFFKKSSIPEIGELKKIINLIKKFKPNYIFSVGGGAVMDLAKTSNFLWKTKNLKKNIIKPNYEKQKNFCSLIAVPTTAGSGAEVTSNSVVYINRKKYSVENKNIKPKTFLLFPKLVMKNNSKLKSASGFDAIAQAVESMLSLKSTKESVEFSTKSLKYSLSNYLKYIKRPDSFNSKNMLLAANYSGKAISITKTTAPHALSYPFTAHFGISHGHAVALTFSEFLKFNFENMDNSMSSFSMRDRLKILLKLSETQNLNELLKFFRTIKKRASLNDNFKSLKINIKDNLGKILSGVNIKRLSNNPVQINEQIIKEILLKKYYS